MAKKWPHPIPEPRVHKTFSDWLKALTEPRNAQADLARGIGKTPQHIGRWKNDRIRPESDNLEAIATYLGLPYLDLLSFWEPRVAIISPKPWRPGSSGDPQTAYTVPVKGAISPKNGGFWMDIENSDAPNGCIVWAKFTPQAYAFRVFGDELSPRVKGGEFLIVDPGVPCNPGDEVLLEFTDGRYAALLLLGRGSGIYSCQQIGGDRKSVTLRETEVKAMYAITGTAKASHWVAT